MDAEVVGDFLHLAEPRCIYCKQQLKYPIRKIQHGHVCGRCFDKFAYIYQPKSNELEDVMADLLMLCKFSYKGCKEKGNVVEISRHEKNCHFRDKICPLYELKKCSNPNHLYDLVKHFTSYHSSRVYIADGNTIGLKYEINTEVFEEFWLLAFKEDNVLMHVKLKNERLCFMAYYLREYDDMRQLVCKVQHRSDEIYTNEKICKILSENCLGTVENEDDKEICFDRQTLQKHFDNTLDTTITIERDISNINRGDIFMRLECPVCSNFMSTNIKLCAAGHSICGECESKLNECPLCTLPFLGVRNFGMESIGDLMKNWVCDEKSECPLRKELQCLWSGIERDIIEHIKNSHTDTVVISKSAMRVFQYDSEFCEVIYLMNYGQVFKITCKKDKCEKIMIVIIDLIGHDEEAQKYYYNICFNSMYRQSIIWYTKSKILTRRRIEYHVDYVAIGRLVCSDQYNISFTISRNTSLIY